MRCPGPQERGISDDDEVWFLAFVKAAPKPGALRQEIEDASGWSTRKVLCAIRKFKGHLKSCRPEVIGRTQRPTYYSIASKGNQ